MQEGVVVAAETFRDAPAILVVDQTAVIMHNDYEALRTNIARTPSGRSFIVFDMGSPYFPIHNLGKE